MFPTNSDSANGNPLPPERDRDEGEMPESGAAEAESDPQSATDTEDRRSSPRRRKLVRVLVRGPGSDEAGLCGWVLDRSLGGMCLAVDRAIEAGAIISVCRMTDESPTHWVDLRVLNVRQKDSTFELGCEYVRSPSWGVMLEFE